MNKSYIVVPMNIVKQFVSEKNDKRYIRVRIDGDTPCFGALHSSVDEAFDYIKYDFVPAGSLEIMQVRIPDNQGDIFLKYVIEVDGGNLWSDFPGILEIVDSMSYIKK